MRRRSRVAARSAQAGFLALGVAATGAGGCRTATQVTVEVRLAGITCDQLKGVAIVVARTPAEAEERLDGELLSAQIPTGQCGADPRLLGSLVLTPSDGKAAIVVRARVRKDAKATCKKPDYVGCIVSRRAFAFVEHASVVLPMTLEISCADVPCDVMTSCRTGQCVTSNAECSDGISTCESPAEPVVLSDGGIAPPDGAVEGGGDGSSPAEGGKDSASDAPPDAPGSDGSTGLGTNICPAATPSDCTILVASGVCCNVMATQYQCLTTAQCSLSDPNNLRYGCLGRAHCSAGQLCCMTTVAPGGTANMCASSCPGPIACRSDDDCPSPKTCIGIVMNSDLGNGPLRSCK